MCLGHMVEELRGLDPDALTDAEVPNWSSRCARYRDGEAAELRAVGTFGARKLHGPMGPGHRGLVGSTPICPGARRTRWSVTPAWSGRPMLAMALDRWGRRRSARCCGT